MFIYIQIKKTCQTNVFNMFPNYCSCMITKCAETGLAPPAKGVVVRAAALPAGFLTVNIEFI